MSAPSENFFDDAESGTVAAPNHKVPDVEELLIEAIEALETARPAPLSTCLLYTSPSPRDQRGSRMPSSA